MLAELLGKELERLATPGGKLLLAVSGGPDSMALFRLLLDTDWTFAVATIDHGLREEAEAEVEFVRAACAEVGVRFHSARFNTAAIARERGWNVAETARTLRYQHLASIARSIEAQHIVTAHNRDDQTETVLMQLLRGAAWLSGMPDRTGLLIRPLLKASKQELLEHLRLLGQAWLEDPFNVDTEQERAWLRHEVLPLLRARHADLDERVATLRELQSDQKSFINRLARPYVDLEGGIDTNRLRHKPLALQRAAIAHQLRAHGVPFGRDRLQRIISATLGGGNWRESVGEDRQIRLYQGRLEVVSSRAASRIPVERVTEASQLPAGVSGDALALPDLQFRSRLPGDRMRLRAGTRKLADVLIDARVPREQRDSLRLLASGNQVIWVDGIGPAADFDSGAGADGPSRFMHLALELAQQAAAAGELPVGAVVVRDGEVIASAHNTTEATADPTAHAEVLALRQAAAALADWRLSGCTLYVTLEPCAMCFGAMQQAHLDRVVYAAANTREGATGSVADLDLLPWKRKLLVERGPYRQQAAALLQEFFRQRRNGAA